MYWLKHGRMNITNIKRLTFNRVIKEWQGMRIPTAQNTTTIPAHRVSTRGYRTYRQQYRGNFVTSMGVFCWAHSKGENNWEEGYVCGIFEKLCCAENVRSVHSSVLQSVQRNELENWIKSHGIWIWPIYIIIIETSIYRFTWRRFPEGARLFSTPHRPDWNWGLIPSGYRRDKVPGRETHHSPPSSAEVKNSGTIHPLPHIPSWCNNA
jgi:hypothetical protein